MHCIFVNQNKITFKIYPWDKMSLALSWFNLIEHQKCKKTLRVEVNQFCEVNAVPWEMIVPSTKYKGLSYPTHFIKSRGSVIWNT